MYHTIQFRVERKIDIELSRKQPLERMLVKVDACLRAQIRPYVVETGRGPVEVADLFFEDGTSTRTIPFACFSFVD
ncbi:MAG TPA: hypothetical protein VGY58_18995 [Gemmataceae bacterium]|nr:hypothetical protein [Gemmataceae bacterium]